MEIKTIGILGCGQMGGGITEVAAKAGFEVMVCEVDDPTLTRGLGKIQKSLAKAVERGKLAEADMDSALARITGTVSVQDLADCDIVIEAVFEDIEVKRQVFAELDQVIKPEAVLASNTSSISIAAIAAATKRGDKVIGMHFFNPVPIMELLEVVKTDATSPEVLAATTDVGRRMGKTVIVVKDSPGFATSRLGLALGLEAIRMVEEGVASAADIDTAMKLGYRHPMGPLELTDLVGLDVRLGIAEELARELGPRFEPPRLLRQMVDAGKLGRKSGEGFYVWNEER